MRKYLIRAALPLLCLYGVQANANTADSARIAHVTDGNISEWAGAKFEKDEETQLSYAIDHDAANLYIAMKVASHTLQMKLMMQGMSLLIDKKGKKKDATGIEFPVKKAAGSMHVADPKELRDQLAATMIFLKTFGFDDMEDQQQLIAQPGSVNVAFDWDAEDNMYIEYLVPLRIIADPASLKGKAIAVGWKFNGFSGGTGGGAGGMRSEVITTRTELVAVPAGSRPSGGGGSRGGSSRSLPSMNAGAGLPPPSDPRGKEQYVWTKYQL